jgi:hypothetical protein
MTLNQVNRRIKQIALAHKQVRNFYRGLVQDFLVDHTTQYCSVFLQDIGGTVSFSQKATLLNYRMWVLDLVHVSEDSKENEQDVLSDTLSIIMDLAAQMNAGLYNDWKISLDNNIQQQVEDDNDMVAGWYIDFTVSVMFTQNICAVPSDLVIETPTDMPDKLVYDLEYFATGDEGTDLTIPTLAGQKLLFVGREGVVIHKVSNLPDSLQFTWDNTTIKFGIPTNPGERYLFLYRNY